MMKYKKPILIIAYIIICVLPYIFKSPWYLKVIVIIFAALFLLYPALKDSKIKSRITK